SLRLLHVRRDGARRHGRGEPHWSRRRHAHDHRPITVRSREDGAMTARARIAVVLAASLVALAGCGDDTSGDQKPASGRTHTPHHSRQSDTASDDTSESASPQDTVAVPVYFTGRTPQGTRLYREFQRVDSTDALDAALTLAASGDAQDPDYGTALPNG